MLAGFENKEAQAYCTFAYCDESCADDPILFQGIRRGSIVEPFGSQDFGWDPIFIPEGHLETSFPYSSLNFN